jgi:hypothetical protein
LRPKKSCLFDPLEPLLSPELQAVSQTLRAEHQQMRTLILDLQQGNAIEIPHALSQLGGILETHIKKEEQVYFAGLEREVPAETLLKGRQSPCSLFTLSAIPMSVFLPGKYIDPKRKPDCCLARTPYILAIYGGGYKA